MKLKITALTAGLVALFALHLVQAQETTKTLPRIGFIISTGTPATPSFHTHLFETFLLGLRDLGYVEGKNVLIERRYAQGRLDRMPALVNELVQQKVDVIVAVNNVVIRAAKKATNTIPIVMISSVDPVVAGYVKSFARPGKNITGLCWLDRDINAKRLELLKEMLPGVSRVAALWDANGPGPALAAKKYAAAARAFKLEFRSFPVHGPTPDFANAFNSARAAGTDALIVVGNAMISKHAQEVFDFATKNLLPTMTEEARYVKAGGLISYGASLADLYRRAAGYVAEILKGAKPGDLTVKLPQRLELYVNLKTANKLGVEVPQQVLVQADQVIISK